MFLIIIIFSTIYTAGQAICEVQSFKSLLDMFWKD